jgi:uncharacterized cupin superfamily protein
MSDTPITPDSTIPVAVSTVGTTRYEPFLFEGRPFGEVHWLRTASGGAGVLYAGLWRHGPATFDYVFPGDETFHVLEGRVSIRVGEETVDLGPGDIASFAKGRPSTWTIHEAMKKFFVISG